MNITNTRDSRKSEERRISRSDFARVAGESYVKFRSGSVRDVCMDGEVERDGASVASDKREDKAACIIHTHAPSPKAVTLNSE